MNGTILVLEIFPSLMDVNGILPVKKIEYCFTFVYLPEKSIWSFFLWFTQFNVWKGLLTM